MSPRTSTRDVLPIDLEVDDELEDGSFVTAVYLDDEGVWVETSDGAMGYVTDERKPWKVTNR